MSIKSAYRVASLSAAEIDQAFPLAEAARATEDLRGWRDLCETVLAQQGSSDQSQWIFACANALGYIKGIYLVRLREGAGGPVLEVPMHVVATTIDDEGVRAALDQRLRGLAASMGIVDLRFPAEAGAD